MGRRRRITRRFTDEQKMQILHEIDQAEVKKEVLDRYDLHWSVYLAWKRKLLGRKGTFTVQSLVPSVQPSSLKHAPVEMLNKLDIGLQGLNEHVLQLRMVIKELLRENKTKRIGNE